MKTTQICTPCDTEKTPELFSKESACKIKKNVAKKQL
jgi:hypothetical protein